MYDLKIFTQNVGPNALNQIYTLMAQSSFIDAKVRIMPDCHVGMGCVVGFTSTMADKVIPNVIGVDIGCGMLTVSLGKIEIDYEKLDDFIKKNIPTGSNFLKEVRGEEMLKRLRCYDQLRNMDRLLGSLGTLGGGNHFIEVDQDENGEKYLVIHSGSRNLGTQVANIYQKIAVDRCKNAGEKEKQEISERLKREGKQADIPQALQDISAKYAYKSKIPNDLCYLDGKDKDDYMFDMRICQEFAVKNRELMAKKICEFLRVFNPYSFETVHNFIDEYDVIRKGAIPAHKGQIVLIPMNMRDGCLVCEGKGNPDWNCSAPHGAGRLVSRSEAKELITLEEFQKSMQGIYTTTANTSTIDEAPMAYKPMQEIIDLVEPTVKILKIIKPVYNFKASE